MTAATKGATPTPRTDTQRYIVGGTPEGTLVYWVEATFARDLERALSAYEGAGMELPSEPQCVSVIRTYETPITELNAEYLAYLDTLRTIAAAAIARAGALRVTLNDVNRMAWSDDKTELRRIARLTDAALAATEGGKNV